MAGNREGSDRFIALLGGREQTGRNLILRFALATGGICHCSMLA